MDNKYMQDATERFYKEVLNRGNLHVAEELLSRDLVDHEPSLPGITPGYEGFQQWLKILRAAFPDFQLDIQDMAIDGDKVWVRSTVHGKHAGQFMGMPPTGKSFKAEGFDILRYDRKGKIVEHWGVFDQATMMQQLGMLAQPGSEQRPH